MHAPGGSARVDSKHDANEISLCPQWILWSHGQVLSYTRLSAGSFWFPMAWSPKNDTKVYLTSTIYLAWIVTAS